MAWFEALAGAPNPNAFGAFDGFLLDGEKGAPRGARANPPGRADA